jgi:hypothetical protein
MTIDIPQGSLLSLSLYLFYNTNLLEDLPSNILVIDYMDNIYLLTWGLTVRDNYARLRQVHQRAEQWENTHIL